MSPRPAKSQRKQISPLTDSIEVGGWKPVSDRSHISGLYTDPAFVNVGTLPAAASVRCIPPFPSIVHLRNPVFQRLALALLPALIISSIALFAVWGDNGLFARHRLKGDLRSANAGLASIERRNQGMLRELHAADQDPIVLERMVAEELGWGREGTTIYRFED